MVLTATIAVRLPNCTAQELCKILYEDTEALRQYHKQVNKDEDVKIADWVDDKRLVTFRMPITLIPSWLMTSVLGTDSVEMLETQTVAHHDDGSTSVLSEPVVSALGAGCYKSSCNYVVTSDARQGCELVATVTCEAPASYWTQSTIEGYMIDQAKSSIAGFLAFCRRFVNAHAERKAQSSDQLAPIKLQGVAMAAAASSVIRSLSVNRRELVRSISRTQSDESEAAALPKAAAPAST